jgi:hypothetical protein
MVWPFRSKRKRLPAPTAQIQGDSGTSRSMGQVTGYEQTPILTNDAARARQFRDMIATDGKLAGAYALILHTLKSAEWRWVAPRGSNANAARNAEFLNCAFGLDGHSGMMLEPWEVQLERLLAFVWAGWSMAEPVYYFRDGSWWLREFRDREPESFVRWVWDESGDMAGMVQFVDSIGHLEREVDGNKLVVVTLFRTGDNLNGRSLFRPCWGAYQLKLHALKQLGYGLDRWAVPFPVVESDWVAAQAAGMMIEDFKAELAQQQAVASRLQSRDAAYATSSPFVRMGVLGEGAFDPTKIQVVLNMLNEEMLTAVGAQFLQLGVGGQEGSRSIGEVHESTFRRGAINLLDLVANAVGGSERPGGGTGATLLRWEYYHPTVCPPEEMPVLEHRGLKAQALIKALNVIPNLVASDVLDKDQVGAALEDEFGLEARMESQAAAAPEAGNVARFKQPVGRPRGSVEEVAP